MIETIREQIDRKLRANYTLLESNPDGNVWVCKEKIDYDSLYEALIEIHKKKLRAIN
jgi:hypothetical protein